MPGGIYSALSGMRTRLEDLDRVAEDLANVNTAGYKTERTTATVAERPSFARQLDSAIDVMSQGTRVDFRSGALTGTGRALDTAIEGNGFFEITTPAGPRYTRDGAFMRRGDGTLTTRDGFPVAGEGGEIKLGAGPVNIAQDGTIRTGDTVAGRLKVVSFESNDDVQRESGARFRSAPNRAPGAARDIRVVSGSLESANVSVVDRMVTLTEISRSFEGLQRGISILANDVDGRAISELGRR